MMDMIEKKANANRTPRRIQIIRKVVPKFDLMLAILSANMPPMKLLNISSEKQ